MSGVFQVGFGRTNITPAFGVPLAGYGNTHLRISETVLDELMVSCVAIRDSEGNDLLLFSQDLVDSLWEKEVRLCVSNATGIPTDHIILAATHTHCGPDQSSELDSIQRWKPEYLHQVVLAAQTAVADRAEARIYIGKTETENLSFVRHYLMSDGSYAGDNFGDFENNIIVDHARKVDPQLQVIRFDRSRAGKRSVLMVNWQCHPMFNARLIWKKVSADYIGSTRAYVEENTEDLFVFFQGAAGDHSSRSKIDEEVRTKDCEEFGKLFGDYVLCATENMKQLEVAPVQLKQIRFEGKINHTMEDKLAQAQEVENLYRKTERDTGNVLAREYGFSSVYHTNAILRRSQYAATRTMELSVIRIGALAFVTAPCEVFGSYGQRLKAVSPYETTFILTCCNGRHGYIPNVQSHEYGCYESHTGNFTKETGDEMVDTYITALHELNT